MNHSATIIIDNFDSFTWNIVHLLRSLGEEVDVIRNDAKDAKAILNLHPSRILLSPGPGRPQDVDLMGQLLSQAPWDLPILGVCLGHQAIGVHFGTPLIHAPDPIHGRVSMVHHDGEGLFRGVPQEFTATRYHSLILDASKLSSELLPTAWSHHGNEKILMGLRHEVRPIAGVQFHPESFLTDNGAAFMENFIKWVNPVLS